MNAITERFLRFIDNQGLSDYQVWNAIDGLSKSSMSKIRGGLIDVSIKVVAPFCEVYGVDANWLLTGSGDMLKKPQVQDASIPSERIGMEKSPIQSSTGTVKQFSRYHPQLDSDTNVIMVDRIFKIIEEKDLSINRLSKMIGMNQSNLSMQFNGTRKLSLETVSSLLNMFPDISAEWLLRGNGEMLISEDSTFDNINVSDEKIQLTIKNLRNEVKLLRSLLDYAKQEFNKINDRSTDVIEKLKVI